MRARYKVKRLAFTNTGLDDYGNTVGSWGSPTDVLVFGVNFPESGESVEVGPDRLVVDRLLLIPPNFEVNERDRFVLPMEPDFLYEVIGLAETAEGNPMPARWNPGGHLKLRRVDA